MRIIRKFVYVLTVILLLLPSVLSNASFDGFHDVDGHWAETILKRAYEDRLISGNNGYLLPDANITPIQALTILCRVFGAENTINTSDIGLPNDRWYSDYIAKSVYLGLITSVDVNALNTPLSRQNAFSMLAEAFQLIEAKPDMAVLEKFSDSWQIANENRQALASLVSQGIIVGSDGRLNVNSNITRATFLTVIYRIIGGFSQSSGAIKDFEHGAILRGCVDLSGNGFSRGVWFDCSASDITLNDVNAQRAVIRSHELDSLEISGSSHIKSLTLAAQSGDITVYPSDNAIIDKIVIGTGGGSVSTKGIRAVEVTGNGRNVTITDSVDIVIVSGHDNTINVHSDAHIEKLELLAGAYGNRVIADGKIDEAEVNSIRSEVSGGGHVDTLRLGRADTKIDVRHGSIIDNVDLGLTGATVSVTVPERISAGGTLSARATIENAASGIDCRLVWYLDGVAVMDETITTGRSLPRLTHKFEYSRIMQESTDIRVAITYMTTLGEQQEISARSTVKLDNYSKQHWMQLEAPAVLEKVTIGYKGDFTLEWAEANDLDDFEKEVWVNAKDYTSTSEYLLWINLAYQRVNIFISTDDGWELIRTCIVGTGAPGMGTPPGVWTTSYKQIYGWTTATYTVAPVVRFRGESGYAFHSRLYFPRTATIQDPSVGFPISRGCVRMYDDDIWFIHDNVPDGTTVVVH